MKKHFLKGTLILAFSLLLSLFLLPTKAFAEENGWVEEDGGWRYYQDGDYLEDGFFAIDGEYHYFESGYAYSGWFDYVVRWEDNQGTQYLLSCPVYALEKGLMARRWQTIDGELYYFGERPPVLNGGSILGADEWDAIYTYYKACSMYLPGIDTTARKCYLFNDDGTLETTPGWKKVIEDNVDYTETIWYYIDSDYSLLTGWQKIGGKWYYFEDFGEMVSGDLVQYGDQTYLMTNSGALAAKGWNKITYIRRYYLGTWNEETQEFIPEEYHEKQYQYWYYCNADGTIVTGWKQIGGKWYYFFREDDCEYMPAPQYGLGIMAENRSMTINGKTYFFLAGGALAGEGWQKESYEVTYWDSEDNPYPVTRTRWFYCDANGVVQTGWKKISGKWYYFDEDGYMAEGGVYEIDGKKYLFLDNGVWSGTPGWNKWTHSEFYIEEGELISYSWDCWFYCDNKGIVQMGWQTINGKTYYFGWWGMYYGGAIEVDGKYYLFEDNGVVVNKPGWYKKTHANSDWVEWYYINEDGTVATGWQTIGGKTYYFDDWGYMYSDGVHKIEEKYYLFLQSGAAVTKPGWYKYIESGTTSDGEEYSYTRWYYINEDGSVALGWQTIGWKTYYFNTWNGMRSGGSYEIDGIYYVFLSSGARAGAGWVKITYTYTSNTGEEVTEYDWYYCNDDGQPWIGWQKINNKWYYFYGPTGYMVYGTTCTVDGVCYFFSDSGALAGAGWQKESDIVNGEELTAWHYTNAKGVVQTGWQKIGGKWYYFADQVYMRGPVGYRDGVMVGGRLFEIDGQYEYFEKSGAWVKMTDSSSWRRENGKLRYYKANGSYTTGWLTLDGKYYFFDSDGYMKTGWVKSGGKWYYCDPYAVTERIYTVGDKRYYFDASGAMQTGELFKYEFLSEYYQYPYWLSANSDGSLYTGWRTIDGKTYYFRPAAVCGDWYQIDGKFYHFDKDGVWTGEVED